MKKFLICLGCLLSIVLLTYAKSVSQERLHGKGPTPVTFADGGCSSSSSSSSGGE